MWQRPVQSKSVDKLTVAVLYGGIGSERSVSLQSGQNIYQSLQQAGFSTRLCDITPDNLSILDDGGVDVFFLALHGQFGEDGTLQEILEQKGLAFTGSGSQASRAAFDKIQSKAAFAAAGVPVARHVIVQPADTWQTLADKLSGWDGRFVIKPARQGSSVGIEMTDDRVAAAKKAVECFQTYGDCLIEQFIKGREMTVGILDGQPLPILEIRSKSAFYDYFAKYIADTTEYLFDTISDRRQAERIQQAAVACFRSLGCRHLSRVDFIVDEDYTPYALEINTLPGFTSHSLLPMAAAKAGIPAPELCRRIVSAAWRDYCQQKGDGCGQIQQKK